MRRVLLIATMVALGLAGTAYAATVVTNVYVLSGSVKPKKSGTVAHPAPVGATIGYSVATKPSGNRPNVVKTLVFTVAGLQSHTNAFPTCSTSRLIAKGPSSCAKGSQVGSGKLVAEIGAAAKQSGPQTTCTSEVSVYNGGGNSLSYYVYVTKAAGQCVLAQPVVFASKLTEKKGAMVETINVPLALRHPGNNTAVDAAAIKATLSFGLKTTTLKSKKVKGKKVAGKKVGFFESIACAANHKRHVSAKFVLESGASQTVTANFPCS